MIRGLADTAWPGRDAWAVLWHPSKNPIYPRRYQTERRAHLAAMRFTAKRPSAKLCVWWLDEAGQPAVKTFTVTAAGCERTQADVPRP